MRGLQPTLPTDRRHDLPRFWDGLAVVWDGWQDSEPGPMFLCPPSLRRDPCPACGSLAARLLNRGRVAMSALVTHELIARRDAERDRLPLDVQHRRPGVALYRLHAYRCVDCRHDQVLEGLDTWWDLDESDYTDEGSRER